MNVVRNVERRASPRRPASVYVNRYIDGQPHLCEAIELSASGMLVRKIHEPDAPRACYAVELDPSIGRGEAFWLCATPVWSNDEVEALAFVAPSERDRARIAAMIAALPG